MKQKFFEPFSFPSTLSELEWKGRLKVERSLAVKCPSIGYHLVTAKKVQQAIAAPGVLERFLQDRDAINRLRQTFTGLYPLDDSDQGREAIFKVGLGVFSIEECVCEPCRIIFEEGRL